MDYIEWEDAEDEYSWLESCTADWEFWGTGCMEVWKMPDGRNAVVCSYLNEEELKNRNCEYIGDWP